ncbi:putative branched-chain amino acid aminotransferase [Phaeomoniella chlamydospora]|uniref:Putative branched-chain amino acid aminotransferase n=1 Tax=Phaeomoniella chlamydospora TaxID=158046 RepID=A0A0G2DWP2_PHACM|nr:putative branched-chain amino acid aminotransferase [Phaeomoniella chlamydospora]
MTESFPPPPTSAIDWNNVGFKVREVNGHIESTFSYSKGGKWSTPKFVASPYLNIHGMAPGLNYGVQSFEGLKAFRHPSTSAHPNSITIFRPDQNAKRMAYSASYISCPAVPEDLFIECCKLAVGLNAEYVPSYESGAAMYVRPLIFASCAQLGLNPADKYTFVVFVMPTGVYHGIHAVDALILEDFDRSAPEGTGSAKLGGNYAPVLRHSQRAYSEGYGITLHLDSKTRSEIDEFSTSGFLGVKYTNKKDPTSHTTIVVPSSKNVIKSVTSDSVQQIARSLFSWTVENRRIPYEELSEFDEIIAAGTAASLVPVRSISMKSTGEKFWYTNDHENEEPGPVCLKLLTELKGIQMGKREDKLGWCSVVDRPDLSQVVLEGEKGAETKAVDQLP